MNANEQSSQEKALEIKIQRRARRDRAHHHPAVRKVGRLWAWDCECGASSCRTVLGRLDWRQAVIGAMYHSAAIAA